MLRSRPTGTGVAALGQKGQWKRHCPVGEFEGRVPTKVTYHLVRTRGLGLRAGNRLGGEDNRKIAPKMSKTQAWSEAESPGGPWSVEKVPFRAAPGH